MYRKVLKCTNPTYIGRKNGDLPRLKICGTVRFLSMYVYTVLCSGMYYSKLATHTIYRIEPRFCRVVSQNTTSRTKHMYIPTCFSYPNGPEDQETVIQFSFIGCW
jgi:hypothetical protein